MGYSNASTIGFPQGLPCGQKFGLVGRESASNTGYATGKMNNFDPSASLSFPQEQFIPPPMYPSLQGQMDGIKPNGDDLASQTLLARLGGGMFTDTTIHTPQAAPESALVPVGQLGAFNQGGIDPREQELVNMLNTNLLSEIPVPTSAVALGLDPLRPFNVIGQGGLHHGYQEVSGALSGGIHSKAPIPKTTQTTPRSAVDLAGQLGMGQGGFDSETKTCLPYKMDRSLGRCQCLCHSQT